MRLTARLLERSLVHGDGVRKTREVEEHAAELERHLGPASRLVEEREAFGKVFGRRRSVDQPLREPELDEHLCARLLQPLFERAGWVAGCGVGGAPAERATGRDRAACR